MHTLLRRRRNNNARTSARNKLPIGANVVQDSLSSNWVFLLDERIDVSPFLVLIGRGQHSGQHGTEANESSEHLDNGMIETLSDLVVESLKVLAAEITADPYIVFGVRPDHMNAYYSSRLACRSVAN